MAVVDRDVQQETPPAVIGSIALGVGPLPFLAIYAVLFIAHGFIYPVQPPDITGSRLGEGIAGIICTVFFLVGTLVIFWFLNARRRWPFVIAQLATLGTSIDFVIDATKGPREVSVLLALTSFVALVLALVPASWAYMGYSRRGPKRSAPAGPMASSAPMSTATASDVPA